MNVALNFVFFFFIEIFLFFSIWFQPRCWSGGCYRWACTCASANRAILSQMFIMTIMFVREMTISQGGQDITRILSYCVAWVFIITTWVCVIFLCVYHPLYSLPTCLVYVCYIYLAHYQEFFHRPAHREDGKRKIKLTRNDQESNKHLITAKSRRVNTHLDFVSGSDESTTQTFTTSTDQTEILDPVLREFYRLI